MLALKGFWRKPPLKFFKFHLRSDIKRGGPLSVGGGGLNGVKRREDDIPINAVVSVNQIAWKGAGGKSDISIKPELQLGPLLIKPPNHPL